MLWIEDYLKMRQKLEKIYTEAFREVPQVSSIKRINGIRHAENMYVIKLDLNHLKIDRDEFIRALQAENIFTSVHYRAVHLQPYYRETFGYKEGDCPIAEDISNRILTLPFSPKLTEDDVRDAIAAVKKIATHFAC